MRQVYIMQEKINVIEAMDEYLPDVDGVVNCMHNYCLNLKDDCSLTAVVPKNRKDYVDSFPYKVIRCRSLHLPFINIYYGVQKADRTNTRGYNTRSLAFQYGKVRRKNREKERYTRRCHISLEYASDI